MIECRKSTGAASRAQLAKPSGGIRMKTVLIDLAATVAVGAEDFRMK